MAHNDRRQVHEPCGREVAHTLDGRPYTHKCFADKVSPEGFEDPTPRGTTKFPAASAPEKGPWFGALYDGRCSVSECVIYEGDRIRADGQGGYECEDCGDDDPLPVVGLAEDPSQQVPESGDMLRDRADSAPADEFEDPTPAAPKLNVSGQPEPHRDWQGRYIVKDPALGDFRWLKNGKPEGLTRVTTFVKAASDTFSLGQWQKRNVVIGASLRPDILRRAHGLRHEGGKEALDRIVAELDTAAGGKVSADEGTYLHEETEFIDAGVKSWQDSPAAYQQDLKRYVDALAEAGLEPVPGLIERTVMVTEFGGICGTFDRIFYHRASGTYVIGDLKTGKTLNYGIDEIQAQMWLYAHGANQNGIYDWNTDTWGAPFDGCGCIEHISNETCQGPQDIKVREDLGVIVHMPVQGPKAGSVYLETADLVIGAQYAEECHRKRAWPKSKVSPWVGVPIDAEVVPASWEERFGAVTSGEEASALWRQAKAEGLAGLALNDLVAIARNALVAGVDKTA